MCPAYAGSVHAEADLAAVAVLIGDPTRAAMLTALQDGRALPAGELARRARVSAPTASAHLARLVEGGLITPERCGRHRYFRLAGGDVAHALEVLALIAPAAPVRTMRAAVVGEALAEARTCYDHLAGRLGVALADGFERRGLIEADGPERYRLTPEGRARLAELGVDLKGVKPNPRGTLRPCIDWTERRRHLAGPIAARLTARLFELGWIERGREGRSAVLTPAGRTGFRRAFGLELDTVAAA